jgi:hypothetical protein
MMIREITAVFASAEAAHGALERLRELGIEDERLRISAQCALHIECAHGPAEHIVQALRDSGVLDFTYTERSDQPGWMSHHVGRVTGLRVQPGEGDAEAGMPGEGRATGEYRSRQ